MLRLLTLAAAISLAGCASNPPPLNTEGVNSLVIPMTVSRQPEQHRSSVVQWGGQIVAIENAAQTTQLQVLSYPLQRNGRPKLSSEPTGRFVLIYQGFLEPQDFRPGKLVTAVGRIGDAASETIGEAVLVLPTLDAEELRLWRKRGRSRVYPHFGVGISIGL